MAADNLPSHLNLTLLWLNELVGFGVAKATDSGFVEIGMKANAK